MSGKLTLAFLLLIVGLCGYGSVTTSYHPVYFATDSFTVTPEHTNQLAGLVSSLPTTGEVTLYISGHTDAEGNSAYNMNLSQQRVKAVQQALIQLGINPADIHLASYGESKPAAGNTTNQDKARNRRVEIAVKHTVVNSIADLVATDSSLLPQQFTINPLTPQALKGRRGIEIAIPANAFTDAQGRPVTTPVTLTLTEFTDVASAFMHGVTSMSTDGLLESGGMYRLEASANGQPLQLQSGKVMDVKIPAQQPVGDMSVYLSQTDANGQIVWVKTDQAFNPGGQPKDTRTITLMRDKYSSFLGIPVQEPKTFVVPEYKQFTAVAPVKPARPVLRLDKPKDLKSSGLRNITHNKKIQQKMLDRMNQNIEKANARRLARYNQLMAVYLADSALYPQKEKEYMKAKVEYAEYILEKRAELDSIVKEYSKTVLTKRLQYCIGLFVSQSEKGQLYNTDLPYRIKQFCASGNLMLRDHNYEQKIREAYSVVSFKNRKNCYVDYHGYSFNALYAYNWLLSQPEVKELLISLVNDNPYLLPAERKLQLTALENNTYYTSYTNPVINNYYTATIGQLGYVNCDRLRDNDNVVAVKVNSIVSGAQSVAFVKNINASQSLYTGKNNFKNGEELRVLSVYFKDGRPLVAYQDVTAAANKEVSMVYKEMKVEEFKALVLSFI
jgi:hypothetical protein